jgi:hypothetical protein
VQGAPSPLTWLLPEEAACDGQLDHVMFLSYSLNLAFSSPGRSGSREASAWG